MWCQKHNRLWSRYRGTTTSSIFVCLLSNIGSAKNEGDTWWLFLLSFCVRKHWCDDDTGKEAIFPEPKASTAQFCEKIEVCSPLSLDLVFGGSSGAPEKLGHLSMKGSRAQVGSSLAPCISEVIKLNLLVFLCLCSATRRRRKDFQGEWKTAWESKENQTQEVQRPNFA